MLLRDPSLRAYVRQRSLRQHVPVPVHHGRHHSGTSSPDAQRQRAASGARLTVFVPPDKVPDEFSACHS